METRLVHIIAGSIEQLLALDAYDLDLKHHLAQYNDDQHPMVPAILTSDQINTLEAAGYTVEVVSDLDQVASERAQDVSRTNRYSDVRAMTEFETRTVLGYLTADEVESALINLRALHTDIVTLYQMPHLTWEGRTSRAIRLRAGTVGNRTGVLFTAGVHAREWGGSDICITFVVNLIAAYRANGPLTWGGKTYSATQVKTILENLDLYVFPNVNPDGKQYSQTTDTAGGQPSSFWWRKNRNPNTGSGSTARGVDVNRNFEFLWPSGIGTSSNPASPTYKGANAFSEPEARNVRHLFDTFPNIRYYVDIHSFGELMLYSWGDDDNQNTSAAQNFGNPVFNGVRGIPGDSAYREFIPSLDEATAVGLANRMNEALNAVRGKSYTVQQAVGLYPTSATTDDYAFSRHIVDTLKTKVYAYTFEFGTEFVPPYSEMQNIISDVGAAMTELCWAANSDVYVRDNPADTGTATSSGPFWNSPDIWVRNADDNGTAHQNTIRGQDNFIYVRVHNRGIADARHARVRVLISSFAGTQFVYPTDWIPRDASGGIATPGTYLVGQADIPTIAAGSNQTIRVRWPAALIPPDLNWHPCLLVEVAPNDGPPPTGNHVWQHNNLGQKNLTIVNARRGARIEHLVRIGNIATLEPASELVIRRIKGPQTAGVFLDLKDAVLLQNLQPILPAIDTPAILQPDVVTIPTAITGQPAVLQPQTLNLTLLDPAPIMLPILPAGSPHHLAPLILHLPARTEFALAGPAVERLWPAPERNQRAASGLSLATLDNTQLISLTAQSEGRLPLQLRPNETKEMSIVVTVPEDAAAGDSYEFELAQYDQSGQPVGGVTLQVDVTE